MWNEKNRAKGQMSSGRDAFRNEVREARGIRRVAIPTPEPVSILEDDLKKAMEARDTTGTVIVIRSPAGGTEVHWSFGRE